MKPHLVLVSHGMLALETLRSAEMITGPQTDIVTVCMTQEEGLDGFGRNLASALATLDPAAPLVIAADLYGGTPCNVVACDLLRRENVALVAGLNLAMVLEYIGSDICQPDELADMLAEIGRFGIKRVKPPVPGTDDEDEVEM